MPLPEGLVANRALEFLLAPPLDQRLHGVLLFVVGPHVVNQVRGHAEGGVALGAPVLGGQAERGERWRQEGERRGHLKLDGPRALGPEGGGVDEGVLLGHPARHGAVGAQLGALELGGEVVGLVESGRGDGVAHRRVAVQQLGRHHERRDLGEGGGGGAGRLAEGALPLTVAVDDARLADGGEGAAHGRGLGGLGLRQHLPHVEVLLRGVAAGAAAIFVLGVGAREVFAAAVVFEVLGRLLDLGEGAAFALPRFWGGARRREGPVVLLKPVHAPVVLRRGGELVFGLGLSQAARSTLPVLHVRELPLPRALAADLRLLVAGRAGPVVLQIPGQVVKVRGGLGAVLGAAEALGAAQLGAGPGRGGGGVGAGPLGAALLARLLLGTGDALQSLGAPEPEVGQEWKLKLEALAAVWTRVVGRTWRRRRRRQRD